MRRPQHFAKSSPYFWLALHRTKVRWRFCKILWPSQNIYKCQVHLKGTHLILNDFYVTNWIFVSKSTCTFSEMETIFSLANYVFISEKLCGDCLQSLNSPHILEKWFRLHVWVLWKGFAIFLKNFVLRLIPISRATALQAKSSANFIMGAFNNYVD